MVRLFGTTIEETIEGLRGGHLGKSKKKKKERAGDGMSDRTLVVARLVVSALIVVGAFLAMILSDAQEVRSGAILLVGGVSGYWLK